MLEIAMAGDDRYIGSWPVQAEILGTHLWIHVHLARVRHRFVCVGLDVRTFYDDNNRPFYDDAHPRQDRRREPRPPENMTPIDGKWVEVSSGLIRALRTSEVIGSVQDLQRMLLRQMLADAVEAGHVDPGAVTEEEFVPEASNRRGRKRVLSDETLREVVAPAYLTGGRKPVVAVQEALVGAGEYGGIVTIDHARKAVSAARRRGFIPPAQQGGKSQERRS